VEDPLRHASALDIAVIPSRGSEALSRSALEFMALGVPVVASRVGILPEVVSHPAQLVEPGDPAQLADALARLLDEPEVARDLGAAGQARVRREYSLPILGQRAEQAARDAIAQRREQLAKGGRR
jgi:glycosyltransferase involved in cell wall biosynthesis